MPCWAWCAVGGQRRLEAACARALDAEAVSVSLIGRMIERATEAQSPPTAPAPTDKSARFERDPEHFATTRAKRDKAPPSDGHEELLDAEGGAA